MIGRLLQRGVRLRIGRDEIRAADAGALHDALVAHTGVSAMRIAELGTLGERALGARARELDELVARVAGALSDPRADSGELIAQLVTDDPVLDRGWSAALASAHGWNGGSLAEYRRALLRALLDHLCGERECVHALLANRARSLAPLEVDPAPRQRLLLDAAALAGDDPASAIEFRRLPRGEPVDLVMARGCALDLMLAQHRFLVVAGAPWILVDDVGEDVKLRAGRNVVGRSVECDAVIHEGYRAISRRHAVFEIRGDTTLRITDISSLGTFLPRAHLDDRLH